MGLAGICLDSQSNSSNKGSFKISLFTSLSIWYGNICLRKEVRIICVLIYHCFYLFQLLTVNPENNSLALVYRDRETLKFVKHINHRSLEQKKSFPNRTGFWDFSFVYYEWQSRAKLEKDLSWVLAQLEELRRRVKESHTVTCVTAVLKTVCDCPLVGLIMIVISLDLELGARYLPLDVFFLKDLVFNIQFFIFHIGFFND